MENNSSKDLAVLGQQLELFQSSRTLNLSENYEAIPKHVNSNDPDIEWRTEEIAKPVNKIFEWGGKAFTCEIEPAYFEDRHGVFRSHFPELREARVEYAIISLASKSLLHIDMDSENNKIFVLKTSYYQIQKEIVEAINNRTNKNLKPNSCPYNTTAIHEALTILKKSVSTIKNAENPDKKEGYMCNRIKDFYYSEKKLVIELGNFVTNYISSGDWKATDSDSILASTGMYELKLRVLLNMKFRYASRGMKYSPSIDKLVREIQFVEHKQKRITLQKVVTLLEKMHEVREVVTEKKYEGRKLVGAIVHIFPTDSFIQTMIDNNALTKRTETPLHLEETGDIMLEPVRTQYASASEYQKAMSEYKVEQGKMLHKVRHNLDAREKAEEKKWKERKDKSLKTFLEGS